MGLYIDIGISVFAPKLQYQSGSGNHMWCYNSSYIYVYLFHLSVMIWEQTLAELSLRIFDFFPFFPGNNVLQYVLLPRGTHMVGMKGGHTKCRTPQTRVHILRSPLCGYFGLWFWLGERLWWNKVNNNKVNTFYLVFLIAVDFFNIQSRPRPLPNLISAFVAQTQPWQSCFYCYEWILYCSEYTVGKLLKYWYEKMQEFRVAVSGYY